MIRTETKDFTLENDDGAVEQGGESIDGITVTEVRTGTLIFYYGEIIGLIQYSLHIDNKHILKGPHNGISSIIPFPASFKV